MMNHFQQIFIYLEYQDLFILKLVVQQVYAILDIVQFTKGLNSYEDYSSTTSSLTCRHLVNSQISCWTRTCKDYHWSQQQRVWLSWGVNKPSILTSKFIEKALCDTWTNTYHLKFLYRPILEKTASWRDTLCLSFEGKEWGASCKLWTPEYKKR